jgi:hypothetical protein
MRSSSLEMTPPSDDKADAAVRWRRPGVALPSALPLAVIVWMGSYSDRDWDWDWDYVGNSGRIEEDP